MARVDDYINAKALAAEALAGRPPDALSRESGYAPAGENALRVPFLNRTFLVTLPGFAFTDEAAPEKPAPIQEEVLILHYLLGDPLAQPSADWAAYREIPGAAFYFSAFVKRAVDPLKNVFGSDPAALKSVAPMIGGAPFDGPGDAAIEFFPFPRVPVRMILYAGDDEFPAEAAILFDRSAGRILSPEDLAWLSGMMVYRMAALAGQKK